VQALHEVTLDVFEKELVTVLGPSGCGKSTLLRIIAGLLSCTKGEIRYRDKPLTGPRQDIAVVFQDPVLLPWRTVMSNVMLPSELLHLDRESSLSRASQLLDLVGLTGFDHMHPWELSGGMKQRVSIARALMTDPSILLMDEPFNELDFITREQMNIELLKICEKTGKTVFFITHSIAEAILLGNRAIVMTKRPGRIRTILDIVLERRDRDTTYTQAFGDYAKKIESLMKEEPTL
jgi:NitT/TauT family transport system ATP-binding protein